MVSYDVLWQFQCYKHSAFQAVKWVISGYRLIELWWFSKEDNINQIYSIIKFLSLIISVLRFIEYHQQARDSLATVKITNLSPLLKWARGIHLQYIQIKPKLVPKKNQLFAEALVFVATIGRKSCFWEVLSKWLGISELSIPAGPALTEAKLTVLDRLALLAGH